MKLSRALKLKKKLSGEISHLQRLISSENLQVDENRSRFNVADLLSSFHFKQAKLISIKTQIAKANKEIWDKIFAIAEIKSEIAFLRSLNTQEGVFSESHYGREPISHKYIPQLNKEEIEKLTQQLEKDIEDFQDEIDEHNQISQVE